MPIVSNYTADDVLFGYMDTLEKSTAEDWFSGLAWYEHGHAKVCGWSFASGKPFDIVVECTAIASAQKSWSANIAIMELLVTEGEVSRLCTPDNRRKLSLVWYEGARIEHLVGNYPWGKVPNFARSLAEGGQVDAVTVDSHMLNAALMRRSTKSEKRYVMGNAVPYSRFAEPVRWLASTYNITPPQMQAVIWVASKRLYGRFS